jgi:hypothetical protein
LFPGKNNFKPAFIANSKKWYSVLKTGREEWLRPEGAAFLGQVNHSSQYAAAMLVAACIA